MTEAKTETEVPLRIALENRGGDLVARFENHGPAPLALTFWWTRRLAIHDEQGAVVAPGPGPVLPCGVAEHVDVVAPGAVIEQPQGLSCTQPAGGPDRVGWAYALRPGRYRVTLIFESPPSHGFTQHEPHPQAFVGRVVSNAVDLEVKEAPGFFARLFGAGR